MTEKMVAVVVCALCGWKHLPEDKALVPSIEFMTEKGKIPLQDVRPDANAYCYRCAKLIGKQIPEAVFFRLISTKREIARRIEAKEKRQEALKEFDRIAKAISVQSHGGAGCVSSQPLLSAVPIKTVDKNGNRLRGIVAANQIRKGLATVNDAQTKASEAAEAAKLARRENAKAERALKQARAANTIASLVSAPA